MFKQVTLVGLFVLTLINSSRAFCGDPADQYARCYRELPQTFYINVKVAEYSPCDKDFVELFKFKVCWEQTIQGNAAAGSRGCYQALKHIEETLPKTPKSCTGITVDRLYPALSRELVPIHEESRGTYVSKKNGPDKTSAQEAFDRFAHSFEEDTKIKCHLIEQAGH